MNSEPIYALKVQDVYQDLETAADGLAEEEIQIRQSLYGFNILAEPPQQPYWQKIAIHFSHPMALLLLVAGVLAMIGREVALGFVIWAVVLVNALFSFWREYRAGQAVKVLQMLLPVFARVMRAGEEQQVPAREIVPGDVLVLAEGDNIPADARVVEEFGLRTNNSTLTGEAVPGRKTADASLREGISELERPNLVFAGTSVVSGTARAVVYNTGMLTQFGRIARLTQSVKEEPSPLQSEIERLTKVLSMVAFGVGLVIFAVAAFDPHTRIFEEEQRLVKSFIFALGIFVASVPEGLPATLTLSLAMAVQRLAQRGVLVKKLSIVETLGNISVICTDKSGTLTQNQMTLREVWVAYKQLSVTGVGYDPSGSFFPDPASQGVQVDLEKLLEAGLLCNNSRINPPTAERPLWTALGDQTEAALRVAGIKGGLDDDEIQSRYPRVHELPFDARRKRMTTIHRYAGGEIAFIKGAPREVLQLCSQIQIHGETVPLNEKIRSEILAINDNYARNALRVLALAYHPLPPRSGVYSVEKVESDLVFLGLAGMLDPPRPEVAKAVETCRQAGIRMVMVTGDYGLTAETLARRIGMLTTSNPTILTGADLELMTDPQLKQLLNQEVIYARMAPEHKLRLVAAFQGQGEVVAVTGDGVNDVPALRKADVGVVMGVVGTDVAREAADVILTNDNFSTIVNAVEEGRAVYDNIRKFITYIFSSNIPEVVPFLATSMLRIPLALTVKQILAIDMGTDILPALALGTERPEPDVMKRPPRKKGQPIIDRSLITRSFLWLGLIEAFLCYVGFFGVFMITGHINFFRLSASQWAELPRILHDAPAGTYILAVTMFHAGVVMAQIGNVFACRSEKFRIRQLGVFNNPTLFLGILVEILVIVALIYVKPLASLFEHKALPPEYWILLVSYALIVYVLDRIRKQVVHWITAIK